MANTPPGEDIFEAEVIAADSPCHAGHQVGDKLRLNCYESGGMCGFFYHAIFPALSIMQYGGQYPWANKDEQTMRCPDPGVNLTLLVRRVK